MSISNVSQSFENFPDHAYAPYVVRCNDPIIGDEIRFLEPSIDRSGFARHYIVHGKVITICGVNLTVRTSIGETVHISFHNLIGCRRKLRAEEISAPPPEKPLPTMQRIFNRLVKERLERRGFWWQKD